MQNGDLLRATEQEGFEILVTTDQNLKYQQNLANYRLAIVVLPTTSWPVIEKSANQVEPHGQARSTFQYTCGAES